MHLLFVLLTFSLIFEIVIAICVVLFCNSPFLCSFEHDLSEQDITFFVLDRRLKAVWANRKTRKELV